jgi:hypothetical protein
MSDTLGRMARTLASRFNEGGTDISDFLDYFRHVTPSDAAFHLGSPTVTDLLGRLNPVSLRILVELLDEVRIQGEAERLYPEAAYWDLIADRVRDELSSRTP